MQVFLYLSSLVKFMTKTRLPLLLWAIGFVTPFYFLEWKWALLIVVFLFAIAPLISIALFAPFKQYALARGEKTIGFISGVMEGVATLGLISILAIETATLDLWVFLGLLVFAYGTNQIARIMKENGDVQEKWTLWGFTATLPAIILFTEYPIVFLIQIF